MKGGSKDTLSQSAGRLIGRDPQYIEQLWQDMNRAFFYPAGREKTDGIGALDLALWDIRGKVLNLPVHEVLGGMVRNHVECYNTAGIIPGIEPGMPIGGAGAGDDRGGVSGVSLWRGGCAGEYDVQHAGEDWTSARRVCAVRGGRGQGWRLGD